jgi:hypothetical protein
MLGLGMGSLLLALIASWALAQAPAREITQIAGEVYRFRNQNHYSVFAVTPAGIIATDQCRGRPVIEGRTPAALQPAGEIPDL